jgi:Kef-type K+ transport system membrane component KefB
VGVVLLRFEVAIEVNPLRLGREHKAVLRAAPAQVIITGLAVGGVAFTVGRSLSGSPVPSLTDLTHDRRRPRAASLGRRSGA